VKQCPWCERRLDDLHWTYDRSRCDDCERERARDWHRNNRERSRATAKAWKALNPDKTDACKHRSNMRMYGLTPALYDDMLLVQKFSCGLCGKHQTEEKKRLAVDHDHDTGKVRMLLCANCNKGIGNLQEDPDLLRRAADYLECFND
jgi:hypothetical protein